MVQASGMALWTQCPESPRCVRAGARSGTTEKRRGGPRAWPGHRGLHQSNYVKLALGKILHHGAAASFDVNYEKEFFVMERSSGLSPPFFLHKTTVQRTRVFVAQCGNP